MTVAQEIIRRGITEIVHFTTNHGLVGMLAKGAVLSRRQLPNESLLRYIAHPNAVTRTEAAEYFDKSADWLDYVNLSVSEINRSYFGFSNRWSHNSDIFWSIMAFDAEILTHQGVHFATTNNVYLFCKRGNGLDGFNAMFATIVRRKGDWSAKRRNRADWLPTCEQAEVLYPSAVPLEYLRKIYVRTDDDHDCVAGWLAQYDRHDVLVEIAPAKFNGVPN